MGDLKPLLEWPVAVVFSGQLWSSVRSTADSYARKYPRGRDVTVFVNPQNPGKSVLEPGRQVIAATCYVLLGVTLCGVVVLYALIG